ncbi:MAG: PIN domain-containing protein [Isosphaera sp.]|nr:PIN domain-containing protein [Isosphaera sp.]
MTDVVLDASALLALLRAEPGADRVAAARGRACISAVNLAEAYGKLVGYGEPLETAVTTIGKLHLPAVAFDGRQAALLASLWHPARAVGLSLGDRACLALALARGLPVLTADRAWSRLDLGLTITCIR